MYPTVYFEIKKGKKRTKKSECRTRPDDQKVQQTTSLSVFLQQVKSGLGLWDQPWCPLQKWRQNDRRVRSEMPRHLKIGKSKGGPESYSQKVVAELIGAWLPKMWGLITPWWLKAIMMISMSFMGLGNVIFLMRCLSSRSSLRGSNRMNASAYRCAARIC